MDLSGVDSFVTYDEGSYTLSIDDLSDTRVSVGVHSITITIVDIRPENAVDTLVTLMIVEAPPLPKEEETAESTVPNIVI